MNDLTPPADRFGDGDIIEPPVTGVVTPAPFNPFAVAASEHISAGAVAIETGRGIAEVQGRMILAKRFPRDSAMAYSRAMNACLRIGLADEGIYKYKRGGGKVEGPSIRLAEEMARCWGNIEYGLNELSRRPGESEMEAFAWDLETNVRSSQRFTVKHIRDKSEGGKPLETERDIYEITANMGARRMRSRILAILPPELVRDAADRCRETVRSGGGEPFEDRIKKMLAAFNAVGVTPAMIAEHAGHAIDQITPDELADLRGILTSIKDNASTVRDHFGNKIKSQPANIADLERKLAGTPTASAQSGSDDAATTADQKAPVDPGRESSPSQSTAPGATGGGAGRMSSPGLSQQEQQQSAGDSGPAQNGRLAVEQQVQQPTGETPDDRPWIDKVTDALLIDNGIGQRWMGRLEKAWLTCPTLDDLAALRAIPSVRNNAANAARPEIRSQIAAGFNDAAKRLAEAAIPDEEVAGDDEVDDGWPGPKTGEAA